MSCLLYPASIDWELTPICNHNCIHCYNYWRGLNLEQDTCTSAERFMSIAKLIVESRPVSVQITGGEPLIVWEKAKDALQLLIDNGIRVSINTNATLVNEEIADFLYTNDMDAFVSFPCCDEDVFDRIVNCKGAAKRAKNGIQTLLNHKVRVSLNMVVTKINYPYVYDTALYVKHKFNVPYFSATKASFPQNAVESFRNQMLSSDEFNSMLKTLLKVKKETGMRVDSAWVYSMCGYNDQEILRQFGFNRKCGCGRYNFVIDSKGNMKACGCDSKTYGNILEETFANAISKMNEWQDGSLLPSDCKSCSNLVYCGGGCRSDAYSTTGNCCGMDSTSKIEGRNRTISKNSEKTILPDEFMFAMNPEALAIRENMGIRLSFRTNYTYVSNEFYEILDSNSCVKFGKLVTLSNNDVYKVSRDIEILLKKKILISVESCKGDSLKSEKRGFAVIVQPYITDDSSQVLKDYLCDLNVRYAPKS